MAAEADGLALVVRLRLGLDGAEGETGSAETRGGEKVAPDEGAGTLTESSVWGRSGSNRLKAAAAEVEVAEEAADAEAADLGRRYGLGGTEGAARPVRHCSKASPAETNMVSV